MDGSTHRVISSAFLLPFDEPLDSILIHSGRPLGEDVVVSVAKMRLDLWYTCLLLPGWNHLDVWVLRKFFVLSDGSIVLEELKLLTLTRASSQIYSS